MDALDADVNVLERLPLGERTLVMGVVNVTPDSFSDGGDYFDADRAFVHARKLVTDGADILDVGGESTRPGADSVGTDAEVGRVVPVIEALHGVLPDVAISIDTTKSAVAEAALDAGATIVNDVSAFRFDPEMADLVADRAVPCVLMHMRGTPETMQSGEIRYDDVVDDIRAHLADRIEFAVSRGVDEANILVDPGIGFGKTVEHNLEILGRLDEFSPLGRPVLVGTSRKSFIGAVTGRDDPKDRLFGTAATVALAVAHGADVVRVHDVAEMVDVVRMVDAMRR